ncbi:tape measure protein [Bartonella sp. DGB1]|uniref:tape measure protein n=1 Tax=Bartonella sp. DGB1 TaxID=3239807 RepID=UPI003525F1AA
MSDAVIVKLGVNDKEFQRGMARVEGISNKSFNNIDRQAKAFSKKMQATSQGLVNAMKAPLLAIGAGFGGKEILKLAEEWEILAGRIKLVTGDLGTANGILSQLGETALKTRFSFKQTAEDFIQLADVMNELGKSNQEQVKFLEASNMALLLSGTSGQAAIPVMQALKGAIIKGNLSMGQFRTLANQASRVTGAWAKSLGKTTHQLGRMASEGKLTAEVMIKGLIDAIPEMQKEMEALPITLAQSFTNLGSALAIFVGKSNNVNIANRALADSINFLANNFNTLANIAISVGFIFGSGVLVRALGGITITTIEATNSAVKYVKSLKDIRRASSALEGLKFLAPMLNGAV